MEFIIRNIYLYGSSVDLRKSINGLMILLVSEGRELEEGEGMLFYNKRRRHIKLLYRDSVGDICLWQKAVKLFKIKGEGKNRRELSESGFNVIRGVRDGLEFGERKSYF